MRATAATCMSQTRCHFYPVRDVVLFWRTTPASSTDMEDTIRLTRCFGVADASSIVDCGEQHAWRPSRAFPPGSRNHHDIIGLRPPAVFHSQSRPCPLLFSQPVSCLSALIATSPRAHVRHLSPRATQVVTTCPPAGVLLPHHPLLPTLHSRSAPRDPPRTGPRRVCLLTSVDASTLLDIQHILLLLSLSTSPAAAGCFRKHASTPSAAVAIHHPTSRYAASIYDSRQITG
jgi:hypothetical protein